MRLNREQQAAADWLALQQDRASSADAVLATKMRPGQSKLTAQRVSQRLSRFDLKMRRTTVHRQCNSMNAHCVT